MASNQVLLHAKTGANNYIFLNPEAETDQAISHHDSLFEFDEADLWNGYNNSSGGPVSQSEVKKFLPRKGGGRNKVSATTKTSVTCASSLPVNIPDWSKVYRVDDGSHHHLNVDDRESDNYGSAHDYDEDDDGRVPIHEYLARRRGASFSVHEGIGRTLKGRDLRQVRNAIWKEVGFED